MQPFLIERSRLCSNARIEVYKANADYVVAVNIKARGMVELDGGQTVTTFGGKALSG